MQGVFIVTRMPCTNSWRNKNILVFITVVLTFKQLYYKYARSLRMLLCYCVFVRHKKVRGMKLFCLLFFLLLQEGSVVFIPIMQLMFVLLFINFFCFVPRDLWLTVPFLFFAITGIEFFSFERTKELVFPVIRIQLFPYLSIWILCRKLI